MGAWIQTQLPSKATQALSIFLLHFCFCPNPALSLPPPTPPRDPKLFLSCSPWRPMFLSGSDNEGKRTLCQGDKTD